MKHCAILVLRGHSRNPNTLNYKEKEKEIYENLKKILSDPQQLYLSKNFL